MVIEAGKLGDPNVTRISITGQGDGENTFAMTARFTHQRVASAIGKGNIANDHVGRWLGVEQLQSAFQGIGSRDNISPTGQQPDQDLPGVPMIFDN